AFDLLLDRRTALLLGRVELDRAKHRHVSLRPVDLVEIDVIDPQPGEARIDRLGDHIAGEIGAAAPNPIAGSGTGDLAGDDETVARPLGEPVAEIGFRTALRPGVRRHRVHLGGVYEVDALGDRVVELRVRLGFAVLLAPGHGAEADLGYFEVGAGKLAGFHVCSWRFAGGGATV